MQQYLPFTVLKLPVAASPSQIRGVATVLTVYGIETATLIVSFTLTLDFFVATVLTVYGIETLGLNELSLKLRDMLQQYLPFTVLKLLKSSNLHTTSLLLQQYLPFTVLKLYSLMTSHTDFFNVATVLTVYGIETANLGSANTAHSIPLQQYLSFTVLKLIIFRKASNITTSCNSTYRLRY